LTPPVVQRFSVRLAPIANRAAEYGPAAPACCNVCRTCTTTNLVGLAIGALTVAGVGVARFARNVASRRFRTT
jgi:hypothetical protein